MQQDTTQATLTVKGFTPYAQIPRWIIRSGDALSHGAVRLYGAIMTYADNDTKAAFPGREKLAEDIGASVATVKRGIKELETYGALIVTRRRNQRTGNFYSNHYVLVFENPRVISDPPPRAMDDPVTTSKVTRPTSCTSDESDKQNTFTVEQSSTATNPGELSQGQRKILRGQLVVIGKMIEGGRKFHDADVQYEWDTFIGMVEEAFPADFDAQFSDLLWNQKWTVSAKVATPYGAGVELNKIINTALSQ